MVAVIESGEDDILVQEHRTMVNGAGCRDDNRGQSRRRVRAWICSYGLLVNGHSSVNLKICRLLLEVVASPPNEKSEREASNEQVWPPSCKVCEEILLVAIEESPSAPENPPKPSARAPPWAICQAAVSTEPKTLSTVMVRSSCALAAGS